MHGPAFIPFGRGRPCILSVPAASGGPPRGDGPPSLACRACGPSGWFGLYPPWGASARPLGWRLGGPAGPGVPAGTGPTFNGCCPLLPCWEPHYSTASRVCARRSRPATHPAGGHIRKPPLLLLLPRSAEPGPLFCVGPALDCAVLLRHCPTGQKGAQHHVYHR